MTKKITQKLKLIGVTLNEKTSLDKIKLIPEETYSSVLRRLLIKYHENTK